MQPSNITEKRLALGGSAAVALDRLVRIAQSDTGQSRIVANFLLAWWNAHECGGFDLTDLWGVDTEIAQDMLLLLRWLSEHRHYPDALGYGTRFEQLVRRWRPEV